MSSGTRGSRYLAKPPDAVEGTVPPVSAERQEGRTKMSVPPAVRNCSVADGQVASALIPGKFEGEPAYNHTVGVV